jgi:tyrosine-protein kinase
VTFRDYVTTLREQWLWVIAGLLLGIAIGVGAVFLVPRQYAASATVIVAAQQETDVGTASNLPEVSAQRLAVYSELLRSRRLAQDVISDLRPALTPDQLMQQISVSAVPDSTLLTATVTNGSPDEAIRLANGVASAFIKDVAAIEQPPDPTRRPAVVGQVFEPAQPPTQLVAPRPVLYVAIGALLGILIGLAVALVRHALRPPRITSRGELEEVLGVPVLAMIGRDRKLSARPLATYRWRDTPLAEAFRQLRTNLQFVDRDHSTILLASARADEGRTTTLCNLALAIAEAGMKVLIVDADLRNPTIAAYLKVDARVGLSDVLANQVPLERAVQAVAIGLDVLPSGPLPLNPSELLGSSQMAAVLRTLRSTYDFVLIDAPPVLEVTDAAVVAARADGVLVVVRQGRGLVEDLHIVKTGLETVSARIVGSVMTMTPKPGRRTRLRAAPWTGSAQAAPTAVLEKTTYDHPGADTNALPSPDAREPSPQPTGADPHEDSAKPLPSDVDEQSGASGPQPRDGVDKPKASPHPRPRNTVDAASRVFDGGGRPP